MNGTRAGAAWPLLLLLAVAAPLGARAGGHGALRVWEWRLPGQAASPLAPILTEPGPPVRLQIPAIGVDAPARAVDLRRDGSLEVPAPEEVGWYRRTAEPGARGSAVLTGHVDTTRAPAVFARLAELRPGDRIAVAAADGWATVFAVRAVTRHAKDDLPAGLWQQGSARLLRLVTCGGAFDERSGHYTDNVVVHAEALGRWRPPGSALIP